MVVKYCDGLCRTDCHLHVQNFFSSRHGAPVASRQGVCQKGAGN